VVVANGIASDPHRVTVYPWIFRWPIFDDALYQRLVAVWRRPTVGARAHGPVPVDPWGPEAGPAW